MNENIHQAVKYSLSILVTVLTFNINALGAVTLDDISYSSLPGDRVQILMKFSESLYEEPVNFTIDNPARIAIDLPDVTLNLAERTQTIGVGLAHSVTAVEAGNRTRVVVNLVDSASYDLNVDGSMVSLVLGGGSAATDIADSKPILSSERGSASSVSGVEDIDFRRGDSGEARIIVTLSDPSVAVNLGQESGQIVVDFLSANLPSELDRRLDVIDFATPVKEIDTSAHSGGARMLISMVTEQYDHLAYQSDNVFTIEVTPLSKEEQEAIKKEKFGFTGERLSLNFQNIEVRAVLQLIADFTGFNLVASDTVRGNVTLRLKNVPWDQALDIILKSKGLGMRTAGNVMMIGQQEEIAARERLELESQRQVEELAPLRTEFVQINYAKASDIAGLIQAGGEESLLSERGTVTIDERTNILIIQDVATSLEAIRGMVARLDVPIRQVMIESRIVNADETFSKDLGVRFGYSKASIPINDRFNTPDGSPRQFTSFGGKLPGDTTFTGGPTSFNTGGADNLLVDLPVAGPAGALGLAIGKIGSYLLQLELSAAQAEGRTQDIANPKVITANQTEATIESGVQIPYQEASSSGASTTSFQSAVLGLRVTPQITPDNRIILDLSVNQDTVGTVFQGVPSINTRSVSTQVLVDDGETVVLGGVYTQSDTQSSDRVPFFGDLPAVGFLFKRTNKRNERRELLIFVTPKILKDQLKI